jgi:outer membrane biosynthesis protein TonB
MAKKTTTKKTTKKAVTAKAPAKKVAAPKKAATAKKAPAKKAAKKKTAVKKAAATKKIVLTKKASTSKKAASPAKKAPANQTSAQTRIIARVDVGFGNALYIRGEGAGLSWEKGTALANVSPYEWALSSPKKGKVIFKFLINDELWAEGENITLPARRESISSPTFVW